EELGRGGTSGNRHGARLGGPGGPGWPVTAKAGCYRPREPSSLRRGRLAEVTRDRCDEPLRLHVLAQRRVRLLEREGLYLRVDLRREGHGAPHFELARERRGERAVLRSRKAAPLQRPAPGILELCGGEAVADCPRDFLPEGGLQAGQVLRRVNGGGRPGCGRLVRAHRDAAVNAVGKAVLLAYALPQDGGGATAND